MGENLLKEIEKGSKMAVMKKKIITHYIYNGSSTITDLAKEMELSVPTVTILQAVTKTSFSFLKV